MQVFARAISIILFSYCNTKKINDTSTFVSKSNTFVMSKHIFHNISFRLYYMSCTLYLKLLNLKKSFITISIVFSFYSLTWIHCISLNMCFWMDFFFHWQKFFISKCRHDIGLFIYLIISLFSTYVYKSIANVCVIIFWLDILSHKIVHNFKTMYIAHPFEPEY